MVEKELRLTSRFRWARKTNSSRISRDFYSSSEGRFEKKHQTRDNTSPKQEAEWHKEIDDVINKLKTYIETIESIQYI